MAHVPAWLQQKYGDLTTENARLAAENERFRGALEAIWSLKPHQWKAGMPEAHKICEQALTGQE